MARRLRHTCLRGFGGHHFDTTICDDGVEAPSRDGPVCRCGATASPDRSQPPSPLPSGISLRIQSTTDAWRGAHPGSRHACAARTRLLLPSVNRARASPSARRQRRPAGATTDPGSASRPAPSRSRRTTPARDSGRGLTRQPGGHIRPRVGGGAPPSHEGQPVGGQHARCCHRRRRDRDVVDRNPVGAPVRRRQRNAAEWRRRAIAQHKLAGRAAAREHLPPTSSTRTFASVPVRLTEGTGVENVSGMPHGRPSSHPAQLVLHVADWRAPRRRRRQRRRRSATRRSCRCSTPIHRRCSA
jgi:hypothetical protein